MLPVGDKLSDELGMPRDAVRLSSSPRSMVWRAELDGTPVVIKRLTGDGPEAGDRYAREVAALTIAAAASPPVAPRLLGTDAGRRVLVLEYLEHRDPGPDDDWLTGYATALARLHATGLHATAPPAPGAATAPEPLPAWAGPARSDVAAFAGLARALDVRFVDFEQACFGAGTVELAYPRIGFPTCWCVTVPSESLLRAAEAAYDTTWRQVTGEERHGDLAAACIGWLIRGDGLVQRSLRDGADHLAVVPRGDWEWGTGTARQRLVHRLGVVSRLTRDDASRAGIARLATAMRDRIITRWPDLPPFPAGRPRT